jgi:endonuclease G
MNSSEESLLRQLVRNRIAGRASEIDRSLRQIAAGNPLGSEPNKERLVARLATKGGLPQRDAKAVAEVVTSNASLIDAGTMKMKGAEAAQGPTIDFVGIEFLARGRLAANTVGRVVFRSGRAQGSGFLVGPGLFLTNNHVVSSAEMAQQLVVEFDYENDVSGLQRPITTFEFDPGRCFVNEPTAGLDFALIAIGRRLSGEKTLEAFGFNPLSDAKDKHMLGEIANIIQHPQGRLKQLVVRENNLISRDETAQVLHYLADTDRGASGSPVCNNDWEPIALHHWGEPALEVTNLLGEPLRSDVNEGVRISAIVQNLRSKASSLQGASSQSLKSLLNVWDSLSRTGPVELAADPAEVKDRRAEAQQGAPSTDIAQRVQPDGAVTWTIPVELSIRLPFQTGGNRQEVRSTPLVPAPPPPQQPPSVHRPARAYVSEAAKAEDFSDRNGYEPGFIPGFVVPLPDASQVPYRLAVNQQALHDEDPYELRYYHFSVVMNADRRLCAFTACNIDGRRVVYVNRDKKTTKVNPTPHDLGVESMEGAEASDDFRPDPRIAPNEQMTVEFYSDQRVPGYDKPAFPGNDAPEAERKAYHRKMAERTARMFQKGHITLRGDPAWGTPDEAVLAEADTFYYTNAAPQLGFFNQGSTENQPGAKGNLRWRAVESYVLRNAVMSRKRVCVLAGPVFDDDDPEYRFGSQVPMKFWKIVVWKGGGALQAIALLADQKEVLERLTNGVPEAMEAFDAEEELARVSEFLSTVEEIEQLTGLSFGNEVRDADIRKGQASESLGNLGRLIIR